MSGLLSAFCGNHCRKLIAVAFDWLSCVVITIEVILWAAALPSISDKNADGPGLRPLK